MSSIRKPMTLLVAALVLAWSGAVDAQPLRDRFAFGIRVAPHAHFGPRYFADPFWGSHYAYGVYYPVVRGPRGDVRVEVTPKQAEVFVDGFYAGTAGDFNGVFKRLHTTPGGHAITLYLDGYRTVTENIYVRPDSTFKMQDRMSKLAAGDVSTPPPLPSRPSRQG